MDAPTHRVAAGGMRARPPPAPLIQRCWLGCTACCSENPPFVVKACSRCECHAAAELACDRVGALYSCEGWLGCAPAAAGPHPARKLVEAQRSGAADMVFGDLLNCLAEHISAGYGAAAWAQIARHAAGLDASSRWLPSQPFDDSLFDRCSPGCMGTPGTVMHGSGPRGAPHRDVLGCCQHGPHNE